MDTENNEKLFNWIYDLIIKEGGDGDAVIGFQHQDYREVAKQFRSLFPDSWNMIEEEDSISFIDNQEYIVLTGKEAFSKIQNWGPRILTY